MDGWLMMHGVLFIIVVGFLDFVGDAENRCIWDGDALQVAVFSCSIFWCNA